MHYLEWKYFSSPPSFHSLYSKQLHQLLEVLYIYSFRF